MHCLTVAGDAHACRELGCLIVMRQGLLHVFVVVVMRDLVLDIVSKLLHVLLQVRHVRAHTRGLQLSRA